MTNLKLRTWQHLPQHQEQVRREQKHPPRRLIGKKWAQIKGIRATAETSHSRRQVSEKRQPKQTQKKVKSTGSRTNETSYRQQVSKKFLLPSNCYEQESKWPNSKSTPESIDTEWR